MKRTSLYFAIFLAFPIAQPAFAQETSDNELLLIQKLRDKGWNDLAKQRIEELLKRNDPVLAAALPLELANISVAEARKLAPDQRAGLFNAARGQIEKYIAKNKGTPEAALAAVELARVTSYHAQAILAKALREEDSKSRHEKARPAEAKFIEAGAEFEKAAKEIVESLKTASDKDKIERLKRTLDEVRFDVAINLIDQAKTYINTGSDAVNKARTNTTEKARKALTELRNDPSSESWWLAKAWLMKIAMEQTTPDDLVKHYLDLELQKANPAAQPAWRLAEYFRITDLTPRQDELEKFGGNEIAKKKNPKKNFTRQERLRLVQDDGEAWVKANSAYLKTYEGQGVLFEIAMAHLVEADSYRDPKGKGKETEKDKEKIAASTDKAVQKLEELAATEGELAERARQMVEGIEFGRLDAKVELTTFMDYYRKARKERLNVMQMSDKIDGTDATKKYAELRKQHLHEVVRALNKALSLTTPSTPVLKVDEAMYYLCGAYLALGDTYRGALVAEALGRSRGTRFAADGASVAIATYAALANETPADQAIRKRLFDMIGFVMEPASQLSWKDQPVTALALYHQAMAERELNPIKSIMLLEKLPSEYPDFVYAMGQLVFIAEDARQKSDDRIYFIEAKDGKFASGVISAKAGKDIQLEDSNGKYSFNGADIKVQMKLQDWYASQARRAIDRMPRIDPASESPSSVAMYFFAKLEKARYLYSEAIEDLNAKQELKTIKKCNELKDFVNLMAADYEKVKPGVLSPKNKENIESMLSAWRKYGDLGIAEAKFRSNAVDRFDQVLAATKAIVDDTVKRGAAIKAPGLIPLRDYRVTSDVLSLALRAYVQKGDITKGQEILNVLKRIGDQDGNEKAGNVVAILLNDISGQVKRMKDDNDPALKGASGNYNKFLDVIAKEYEAKGLTDMAAIQLAHAYRGIDLPAKAATYYAKVKPPASLDKDNPKKSPKETDKEREAREKIEQELGRYWSLQLEYIRCLRETKAKDSLTAAEKALGVMVGHKNKMFEIQALFERNLLFEDLADAHLKEKDGQFDANKRFRQAVSEWQKFLKTPAISGPNLAKPEVQKIYFPAYFHTSRTMFRMGNQKDTSVEKDKPLKNPQNFITGAARMIVALEFAKTPDGWRIARPLYENLWKDKEYDALKKEYDKLKADRMKMTSQRIVPPGTDLASNVQQGRWTLPIPAYTDHPPSAVIVNIAHDVCSSLRYR